MNMRIAALCACSIVFAASAFAQAPQALLKHAKISEAQARETASQKVPDATILSSELEKEHGKLVWSFDMKRAGSDDITEIMIDAKTGKIVSTQVETPADQAREAAADAAEQAKH